MNYLNTNNFILFIFLTGLVVYSSSRSHILLALLSLDYIGLGLFMMFMFFLFEYQGDFYMILMFLGFMVCEAVLGLSILVSMIRCHGNDLISNLNVKKW